MQIRVATADDFPAIQSVLHDAYEAILQAMSAEDARALKNALTSMVSKYGENGVWLIAEGENCLLGCVAYFAPRAVKHPLFDDDWAHIQLLGVRAGSTRRGVGRALMQHCLAAARRDGAGAFGLQTSELMAPARSLYASMGFISEKKLPPAFGHPTYLYVRRVDPPATG